MKRTVIVAALALVIAAAGVGAAAAVTHGSSGSAAAGTATAGRVTLHKTKLGKVLATSSGRTLYLFDADKHGRSACYGQCASYWPPLMKKGKVRAATGVKAQLLGTTKRKNGKLQVTYKGHPLYLYALDKRAGQAAGQKVDAFGAEWYVVSAAGKAIETAAPATTTTNTSTYTNPYP